MRELDLRLARTTERARELKIMARQAAEQAERAAVGVARENKARNRSTCGWVGTLLLSRTFDVPSTVVRVLYTSASSNFPAVTESLHRHVEVRLKPLLDTHVLFTNHAAPTHLPLSLSLSLHQRTSPRHNNKGRGPVAVEDVATNQPRLRLPLPLSSEPAPFGAISSRVSNGSARRVESVGGGGAGLRTERSEMSAASGADGAGSSNRDGHARGGRAFVTQQ